MEFVVEGVGVDALSTGGGERRGGGPQRRTRLWPLRCSSLPLRVRVRVWVWVGVGVWGEGLGVMVMVLADEGVSCLCTAIFDVF